MSTPLRLPLLVAAWLVRRSVLKGGRLSRWLLSPQSLKRRPRGLFILKTYCLLLLPLPERTQEAQTRTNALLQCLEQLSEQQTELLFALPGVTESVKSYWKTVSSTLKGIPPASAALFSLLHSSTELPTPYKKLIVRTLRSFGPNAISQLTSYNPDSQPLAVSIEVAKALRDSGQYIAALLLLKKLPLNSSDNQAKDGIGLEKLLTSELSVYQGKYHLQINGTKRLTNLHPSRVLFLIENALPIKLTGYTVRTEATLLALKAKGKEPLALLRPGLKLRESHPLYRESDTTLPTNYRSIPLTIFLERFFEAGGRLVEEFQPSIIHAVSNFKQGIVARALAEKYNIPWTYELRGLWEDSQVAKGVIAESSDRYSFFRDQENQTLNACHAVITLSETLKNHLIHERQVPREKIFLVPNGVSEDFLNAIEQSPPTFKRDPDKIVLGYFGSFNHYERLDLAIRALPHLPEEYRLRFIGDGEARQALELLSSQLSLSHRIEFLPPVPAPELPGLLRDVQAFFLLREDSAAMELVPPMKLLEMICFDRPIVLTKRRIFEEITPPHFPVTWLPSDDPQVIANHFKKAVEYPCSFAINKSPFLWRSRCEGYLKAWKG